MYDTRYSFQLFHVINHAHLSNGLKVSNRLQLIHSVALGLAVGSSLWNWAFASTSSNTNSVDHKTWRHKKYNLSKHNHLLPKPTKLTLLSSVSQPPRLVRPWGMSTANQFVKLTELPAPNTKQVAHNIALLLPVQLLDVLVRSHLGCWICEGRRNYF